MADDDFDDDDDDDAPKVGKSKSIVGKRLILILLGTLAAFILMLLVAAYFLGWFDALLNPRPTTLEEAAEQRGKQGLSAPVGYFYPLEEIAVTVQSNSSRPRTLKLNLVLELETQNDVLFVDELLPRVIDSFQVFLRDLRVNELEGSQGIYRVREELLRRINAALNPLKIRDVLFANISIQ